MCVADSIPRADGAVADRRVAANSVTILPVAFVVTGTGVTP